MFTIRKATAEDIPLIRELCFEVWPQTYAPILSQAKIDYMLEMMYSTSSLQKQMSAGSQFIFVYDDDEPVGFAAFLAKGHGIYKLDKIYVLPSQQGKGTGKFVIDYIIAEIKKKGATALQLQVNRDNKAKSFYEKLGFVEIDYQDFDIGNGFFMNDYVMEKKL
jgi:ribosomal protein S18 acetylase RimI-like enzyme